MKVIKKEPGKLPEVIDIKNTLEAMQEVVGGYIESFTIASDACIICDEEGRFKNSRFNFSLHGQQFFGTVLIVGVKGDRFTSLSTAALGLILEGYIVKWKEAER